MHSPFFRLSSPLLLSRDWQLSVFFWFPLWIVYSNDMTYGRYPEPQALACWLINFCSLNCKDWQAAPFFIALYLFNWYWSISIKSFVFFIIHVVYVLPIGELVNPKNLYYHLSQYKDNTIFCIYVLKHKNKECILTNYVFYITCINNLIVLFKCIGYFWILNFCCWISDGLWVGIRNLGI